MENIVYLLYFVIVFEICIGCLAKNTKLKNDTIVKISAFNVQKFGRNKMENEDVVNVLVKVIRRYDIFVMQEIVDSSRTALPQLLRAVNNKGTPSYSYVVSPRLGRSSFKEQYGFFYRSDRISVIQQSVYPDPGDLFIREPYVVKFKIPFNKKLQNITLAAIHTQPTSAVIEIDSLADVHTWIKKAFKTQDILILGDYNADCSYVSKSAWNRIRLRTDLQYVWLIKDDADTTATTSDCAYDRMVITGNNLKSSVVPDSAKPFLIDEEYQLDSEELLEVSDHYPIEVELKE